MTWGNSYWPRTWGKAFLSTPKTRVAGYFWLLLTLERIEAPTSLRKEMTKKQTQTDWEWRLISPLFVQRPFGGYGMTFVLGLKLLRFPLVWVTGVSAALVEGKLYVWHWAERRIIISSQGVFFFPIYPPCLVLDLLHYVNIVRPTDQRW